MRFWKMFVLMFFVVVLVSGCVEESYAPGHYQSVGGEQIGDGFSEEGEGFDEEGEGFEGEGRPVQELPYPVKWAFGEAGGSSGHFVSAVAAIDGEGNIYAVSDKELFKVSGSGEKIWETQIVEGMGASISTPPAISSDGTIYVGTYNPSVGIEESEGRVYAVNSDGSFKWDSSFVVKEWDNVMNGWVPGNTVNAFAIGEDGTVYTAGKNGFVQAINADGSLKWKFDALDETCRMSFRSSPSIGEDGTVYVGYDGGSLIAINEDGGLKWEFGEGRVGCCVVNSPAIDGGGLIYFGDEFGNLYAVRDLGEEAEEVWSFQANGAIYSSAAIDAEGNVYFGSWDGKVYKVNNGEKVWEFETAGKVFSSPSVDVEGNVFFGSADGYFYKVNEDGEEEWKFNPFEIGTDVSNYRGINELTGSAAIGEDGTVYFVGGQVIAVEGGAALATPWGKFKGNNQNTGGT